MKVANEIRILREFIEEFSPIYARLAKDMNYSELIEVVKEIAKDL